MIWIESLSSWAILLAIIAADPQAADTDVPGAVSDSTTSAAAEPVSQRDVRLLEIAGVNWRWPVADEAEGDRNAAPDVSLSEAEWVMLVQEARKLGYAVSPEQRETLLARLPVSLDKLKARAQKAGESPEAMQQAIENYALVKVAAISEAAKRVGVPPAEVETLARDCRDQVRASVSIIPVKAIADPSEISKEEIQDFFARYKDINRRQSPDGLGLAFGWRAQIEWLGVDADAVAAAIEPTPEQVKAHYEQNLAVLEQEARNLGASPEDSRKFENVEHLALASVRRSLARQRVDEAMAKARAMLDAPWQDARVGANHFKIAPEEVRAENYMEQMAGRLRDETGLPFVAGRSPLTDLADFSKIPGVGSCIRRNNAGKPVILRYVLLNVQGIVEEMARYTREFRAALFEPAWCYNSYESQPFSQYIYRVIATDHPRPAASVEEVRAQIEADIQKLRARKRTRERADTLAEQARRIGLKAAWAESSSPRETVGPASAPFEPAPFSRYEWTSDVLHQYTGLVTKTPPIDRVGEDQKFVDALFELARSAEPAAEHRVAVIELPQIEAVAVAELLEYRPFAGDMSVFEDQVRSRLIKRHRQEFHREWFSKAGIHSRVNN